MHFGLYNPNKIERARNRVRKEWVKKMLRFLKDACYRSHSQNINWNIQGVDGEQFIVTYQIELSTRNSIALKIRFEIKILLKKGQILVVVFFIGVNVLCLFGSTS